MTVNPLKKLESLGQAIWLDYIRRDLMTSGQLKKLIEEDGLKGITSNPSIFEKAFSESHDYTKDIQSMKEQKKDLQFVYETLTQQDVKMAADEFRKLYNNTQGKDGYVSLEVNPHLAYDTEGTIVEARRLWKALDRPNVFIKVPATPEGLPAIQQLISEGINVNITLLFGLPRYRQVIDAYIAGLEARLASHQPIHHVASVASFFLSRIDTLLDPILDKIIKENKELSHQAQGLPGQVAIASAKAAYHIFNDVFKSDRFKKLEEKGAKRQRLLWASTSTKNPHYSDIKYVESLIGPDTVNTLPMETLDAYRDHGHPQLLLDKDRSVAEKVFQTLPKMGIDIDKITQTLEQEGVDKFNKSFDQLLEGLKKQL